MIISLKDRLNKILVERRIISETKLKEAVEIQKVKGGRLSDILVEKGYVDKNDLMLVLSEELSIPPINLARFKIEKDIVKLIPRNIASHYQIIPISKIGNMLTIAMADPLNVFTIDDIKSLTGFQIGVLITTEKEIEAAIEVYYAEDEHEAIEKIIDGMDGRSVIEMVSEAAPSEAMEAGDLMHLTQETPVIKITNFILADAVHAKSSDILIEPLEKSLRVRYRVDGILRDGKSPPRALYAAIISRIKVMAALDIAERRLPQDGRFKIKIENREVDFRVSILPSALGEKAALRILDRSQATLDLNLLGFEKESLDSVRKVSKRPHGMILICGPTGSGKTTTLYSILKEIDTPEKNLVTVEDPVEYQLHGINQVSIRPEIRLTFAVCLRSILRQDPNVIMVGEIRDFDTADIAIKAALTGHLVLSTLHTTTAAGSIIRLVNMGIEPFLLSSSVVFVAAQRLVRKLCPHCNEPYSLDPEAAKKLKVAAGGPGITLYRPKGCKSCLNSGYSGRAGLMEAIVITPKIRELICLKAQEHEIKAAARQEGMKTLRENGVVKALAGITSLEEIIRLTAADEA